MTTDLAYAFHESLRDSFHRTFTDRVNTGMMLNLAYPPSSGLPGQDASLRDVSRLNERFTTRRNCARIVMHRNNIHMPKGYGNRAFRRAIALCQ